MKKVKIYNEEDQLIETYEVSPDLLQMVKDYLGLVYRVSIGATQVRWVSQRSKMKTYKIEIQTEDDIFDAIKGLLADNFREFTLEEGENKFSSEDIKWRKK